ncbi:MAG TPA: heavy metal translocating P-type ATPase [Vicinamibacterales bacterium]|nr:heavy metal translocating P-type ATPase [Vicinamibacterales bacterium]
MLNRAVDGRSDVRIAALALLSIALAGGLRLTPGIPAHVAEWPLIAATAVGGFLLVVDLTRRVLAGELGSDLLAGLAIVTAVLLGQFLVAVVIVLMLSGGQALEHYATRRASAALAALARRNPSHAHRRQQGNIEDVPLDDVAVGDVLVIFPHETCPVDGIVLEGTSTMDESYLSGEPFVIRKTVGAPIVSGAINQHGLLTIRATRRAVDSRYARIVGIVREAEERRPPMRRLADRLGAWYTPAAVGVAAVAWGASGDVSRFLAVLVIATPCPLLLAIPVAIIGAISLAARRSILIRDAALLERIESCRTVIFDKTGTLTLGRPTLTEVFCVGAVDRRRILSLVASLEQFSRHPLAPAVLRAAADESATLLPVAELTEEAGAGLDGVVSGQRLRLTSRRGAALAWPDDLPGDAQGLECVVVLDGAIVALLRFRDSPRHDSESFVGHLSPRHGVTRVLLTSGDRESEVRYLAGLVGIADVRAGQSPEDKLALVEAEMQRQPTLFVGDGLNDAPAMTAATVAVALGSSHDVTGESAQAVILDGSLAKVDELMHIAQRTRRIALQSAVGGMALSLVGMAAAAIGWLPALPGAVAQEVLDAAAVLNALRAALPPKDLTDY